MTNRDFYALNKQLFALYESKAYQQVLDLVEREQANFPRHTEQLTYWRICMTNLLGRQEEALRLFREAVEQQGLWFEPDWAAQDKDLASLQPQPEFQELLAICRQRLAEAQASARPELYLVQPGQRTEKTPLFCALYGNMNNSEIALEEWRPITEHGWLLAVPQSSQLMAQGMYVWNDRARSISEICSHFTAIQEAHPLDKKRIVLGGFSKGGGLAVWMALHQLIPATGFVVLGPSLTPEELEELPAVLAAQKPVGLRGSILVGAEDEHCLDSSRQVAEIMHAHDLPCELTILPGVEHEYPADFGAHLLKGLAFVGRL